jgi:hypothetical protein
MHPTGYGIIFSTTYLSLHPATVCRESDVIEIENLVISHHPNAELEKVEPRALNVPPSY